MTPEEIIELNENIARLNQRITDMRLQVAQAAHKARQKVAYDQAKPLFANGPIIIEGETNGSEYDIWIVELTSFLDDLPPDLMLRFTIELLPVEEKETI